MLEAHQCATEPSLKITDVYKYKMKTNNFKVMCDSKVHKKYYLS